MIGTAEERKEELDRLYPQWPQQTQWERFVMISSLVPDGIFLIDDNIPYTYRQIRELAEIQSRTLSAAGVMNGDICAVCIPDSCEFVLSVLALSALGAVAVLINVKVSEAEKNYILTKTGASHLISGYEPGMVTITMLKSGCETLIQTGQPVPYDEETYRHRREDVHFEAGRMTTVIFTSGSTSRPKGVILTDDILLRSAYATVNTRHMEKGRRIYLPIPMCHAMGYVEGFLTALSIAGSIVVSARRYKPGEHLERMRRYEVNDIVCISSVMIRMMDEAHEKSYVYPHMHAAYWAGRCPERIYGQAEKHFGIHDLGNGYGLTECGSTSSLMSCSDPHELIAKRCGRLKNAGIAEESKGSGHILSMRIVNEAGNDCRENESGEILLKGLSVTPGYLNDPQATREKIDEDGWFHTGDLGSFDEAGYLSFLGRKDDMFKVNGENVSPGFVEEVLKSHPLVAEAAVVGIPHERCGEVGAAFVQLIRETPQSIEEIRLYAKERLAVFQRPAYIFVKKQDEWPLTITQKISRKELKKEAIEKSSS